MSGKKEGYGTRLERFKFAALNTTRHLRLVAEQNRAATYVAFNLAVPSH